MVAPAVTAHPEAVLELVAPGPLTKVHTIFRRLGLTFRLESPERVVAAFFVVRQPLKAQRRWEFGGSGPL
jgi:hypothetical protein